jgi:hypothetical protein
VHTGFWWGDLREGDHLGDPGVDGGSFECDNEPPDSIKCGEFVD